MIPKTTNSGSALVRFSQCWKREKKKEENLRPTVANGRKKKGGKRERFSRHCYVGPKMSFTGGAEKKKRKRKKGEIVRLHHRHEVYGQEKKKGKGEGENLVAWTRPAALRPCSRERRLLVLGNRTRERKRKKRRRDQPILVRSSLPE